MRKSLLQCSHILYFKEFPGLRLVVLLIGCGDIIAHLPAGLEKICILLYPCCGYTIF